MSEQMNKILSRVQKMLARADADRNDNEHEREIAMRQAHALLAKHGLSMADVKDADVTDAFGPLGELKVSAVGAQAWVGATYLAIAKLNGCFVFKSAPNLVIVGRAARATVVKQMAQYVIESIYREAGNAHEASKRRGERIHGRRFKTDFCNGALAGVGAQVRKILADMERGKLGEEQLSKSHAMVVVNQHALATKEAADLARDKYRLRKAGTRTVRYTSAYDQGEEYGSSMSLNNQIGGKSQGRIGRG